MVFDRAFGRIGSFQVFRFIRLWVSFLLFLQKGKLVGGRVSPVKKPGSLVFQWILGNYFWTVMDNLDEWKDSHPHQPTFLYKSISTGKC